MVGPDLSPHAPGPSTTAITSAASSQQQPSPPDPDRTTTSNSLAASPPETAWWDPIFPRMLLVQALQQSLRRRRVRSSRHRLTQPWDPDLYHQVWGVFLSQ